MSRVCDASSVKKSIVPRSRIESTLGFPLSIDESIDEPLETRVHKLTGCTDSGLMNLANDDRLHPYRVEAELTEMRLGLHILGEPALHPFGILRQSLIGDPGITQPVFALGSQHQSGERAIVCRNV